MKKLAILSVLLVALAGCVSNPTKEQVEHADYGKFPSSYEEIVKSQISKRLKDPYSAVFDVPSQQPRASWVRDFDSLEYGYIVCFSVNAKNGFGAYVGNQRHYALIRNGYIAKTSFGDNVISDAYRTMMRNVGCW